MPRIIFAVVVFMALSGLYPSLSKSAPEPLTVCPDEPPTTDITLVVGDVVQCVISPAADSDLFRFQGTAGTVILLTLLDRTGGCGGAGGYPCPMAQLLEPGNTTPIDTLGAGTEAIQRELTVTGTYTLLVTEAGNDQVETYRISLERLFPPSPNALPICFSCVVTDETLDPAPDRDFFLFEGEQNDLITLTLTDRTGGCGGAGGSPCPVAQLFGPDRNLVDTLGAGTESVTIALPLNGTYTIHVGEAGVDQNETYNLALQCVIPANGSECGPPVVPPNCAGLPATIIGTPGNDNIIGTENDDVIVGLGGSDVMEGRGGNDVICGGGGNDTILGGDGNDREFGEGGYDALFGAEGSDTLRGGASRDVLVGGPGTDGLFGDAGDDLLFGGPGADTRNGAVGTDVCDDEADTVAAVGCESTANP